MHLEIDVTVTDHETLRRLEDMVARHLRRWRRRGTPSCSRSSATGGGAGGALLRQHRGWGKPARAAVEPLSKRASLGRHWGTGDDCRAAAEPATVARLPATPDDRAMRYMLLLYGDQTRAAAMTPPERDTMYAAYGAYYAALQAAGVLLHSGPLQPVATATTLRRADGQVQVLDGPFAETKEELAGYFLLDVPDLDAALRWARDCPALDGGAVEVRPMLRVPQ